MKLSDHILDAERVTNRPRDLRRLRESNAIYRRRSRRMGGIVLAITLIFAAGAFTGGAFVSAVHAGAQEVTR